ncbi:MAG: cytochrome C [Alphaproteobacteria bacterium]|nr:cytochrome C [Alphaproteobacteria bacterium]
MTAIHTTISRRRFVRLAGAAGALGAVGMMGCAAQGQAPRGRVVVIGGGFGGATAAKYVKKADPAIDVTLVEQNPKFTTCPYSNLVLGGLRKMEDITFGYGALADKHGVRVVHDAAVSVDPAQRTVRLRGGQTLNYDKLIMSPGIDIRWNALAGYDEAASQVMPHAWRAGEQTVLLRRQLESMPDGGLVIMVAPANPFRCPPGPYERSCMIGHYLKTNKPRSKLLILDAKDQISKQGLFTDAWAKVYPNIVEWVPLSKDGKVTKVDVREMTVETEFGKRHRGNVVNVIPPQKAGAIADAAGVADQTGWCPVDPMTMESKLQKNIHVIGDASNAAPMPKSGFAANSQAKVVATAVVDMMNGRTPGAPAWLNTCYSHVAPNYGISVVNVYRATPQAFVEVQGSGGVSPVQAPPAMRVQEALFADAWYESITADMFG